MRPCKPRPSVIAGLTTRKIPFCPKAVTCSTDQRPIFVSSERLPKLVISYDKQGILSNYSILIRLVRSEIFFQVHVFLIYTCISCLKQDSALWFSYIKNNKFSPYISKMKLKQSKIFKVIIFLYFNLIIVDLYRPYSRTSDPHRHLKYRPFQNLLLTSCDAWFSLWFNQGKRSLIDRAILIESYHITTKVLAFYDLQQRCGSEVLD